MIKCVIFDLDGVIVSTDEFHYQAWSKLAAREGIYFDRTINHRLRGVSRRESLEIILEKALKPYSETEIEEMMIYKNDHYKDSLVALTKEDILPGAIDLIEYARAKGVKIAIGSSSRNTKAILKYIGLLEAFDTIVDGTMISKSKPDPEVFLKAASALGIDPKECIVIEDALAGIEAAKAAGMKAVAVSDARKSPIADVKVNSLSEIKALL